MTTLTPSTPLAAPWEQLGSRLEHKQSIESWARSAGMNWEVRASPVLFQPDRSSPRSATFEDQKVLFRSDTHMPLSVVSSRYNVVQPREVLEFYRDLTEVSGYELETAGVLKGGRRFWALARTGQESALKGGDVVKSYLLLATSCDGSLATVVTPTTIRVACSNTLAIALNGASSAIRVPHSTTFDAQLVKSQLGIAVSHWDAFMYRMKSLSERKVKSHEALGYFLKVLGRAEVDELEPGLSNERAIRRVKALYESDGVGTDLPAAKGTAWGLLNAVTQFVDHERRARGQDYRLDSAWFGPGAALKQKALDQALQLVA